MVSISPDVPEAAPAAAGRPPRFDAEACFRLIAQNASDVVFLADPAGRFEWISPSVEAVLGWHPDQVLGSRAAEFIDPDDLPGLVEAQGRVMSGAEVRMDLRMRRPDGMLQWVQATIRPLRDPSGVVIARTGSIRDITAEREARDALRASEADTRAALFALRTQQEALRASEERFRVALDALGEGVIVLRTILDGTGALEDVEVVWANERVREDWFAGRPLEELVGRRVWALGAHVSGQLIRDYRSVVAGGRPLRYETTFRDRHGRDHVLDGTIAPFPGGLLHVARDVTDKHRVTRELEEAHAIAGLGVWWRDARTGEATWSPEMYRIFERDPADGPPAPDVLAAMGGTPAAAWTAPGERLAATSPDAWETELGLQRPDGRPLWILSRTRAERDADGRVAAYRGTTLDITDRKLAELTVSRFTQALEERVAARTAALEAANEELRGFSYSLSHDLRAPLRSIVGFASLLQRRNSEQLDDAGRQRLDNVLAASAAMGRVIDDLLRYLRLGHGSLRHAPTPIGPLVDGLRLAHGDLLARTGGRLVLELPAAVPLADPTMLFEILANLVENGLIHVRPGVPPMVTVASRQDGDGVLVSVTDNGVGIAAADHERIFEAFTRLSGDEGRPGTGIGLAVARRAARALGSDVVVESWVGEGSTFLVRLPAARPGTDPNAMDP